MNSGFFRTLQVRVGSGGSGGIWGALGGSDPTPAPPQADPLYLEFFLTVAMEGLSEKYGVELELTGETGGHWGGLRWGWGGPAHPP